MTAVALVVVRVGTYSARPGTVPPKQFTVQVLKIPGVCLLVGGMGMGGPWQIDGS